MNTDMKNNSVAVLRCKYLQCLVYSTQLTIYLISATYVQCHESVQDSFVESSIVIHSCSQTEQAFPAVLLHTPQFTVIKAICHCNFFKKKKRIKCAFADAHSNLQRARIEAVKKLITQRQQRMIFSSYIRTPASRGFNLIWQGWLRQAARRVTVDTHWFFFQKNIKVKIHFQYYFLIQWRI